jgi:alkyl hydroperoxide reductase 1
VYEHCKTREKSDYFQILSLSDPDSEWSKKVGLTLDLSGAGLGLGVRTGRYALIIDDLVVKYVGVSVYPLHPTF